MNKLFRCFMLSLLCLFGVTTMQAQTKTFRELISTTENYATITYTLPANAQVLMADYQQLILWDGTAGLAFYMDSGVESVIPGAYDMSAYANGFTGYAISGTITGEFEVDYPDLYNPSGTLTLGAKAELTPVEITGAETIDVNNGWRYAYILLHGTRNGATFTTDDGYEFYLSDKYIGNTSIGSGAGTVKGILSAETSAQLTQNLYPIEQSYFTPDADGEFEADVMTFAEVKTKDMGELRFMFESNKVRFVAHSNEAGRENVYLWDGTDGILISGNIANEQLNAAVQGQIINGGLDADYNGKYSNSFNYDPSYYSTHTMKIELGDVPGLTPLKKTLAEVKATVNTSVLEFSYLGIKGTVENGVLKSDNQQIALKNNLCPTADLSKYNGKTGTLYGLYQSRGEECVLIVNDYYFLEDDPIVTTTVESISELYNVEEPGDYVLPLAAEDDYHVQVLAVDPNGFIYLWDGQDGVIAYDEEGGLGADKVGTYIYGNVKFTADNPYGTMEYTIDKSTIQQFSAPFDIIAATTKADMHEGDFVKLHATIESDDGDYMYTTIDGKTIWLLDDLTFESVNVEEFVGKTGVITAIHNGIAGNDIYMSVYPDNWFAEDQAELPKIWTLEDVMNIADNGSYLLSLPASDNYKIQVLAGTDDNSIYLYDKTNVFRFKLTSTASANVAAKLAKVALADKIGALVSGNMVITKTDNDMLIDVNTMEFSEVVDLFPPVESESVSTLYSYISINETIYDGVDFNNQPYYYIIIDGQIYVLSDALVTLDKPISDYVDMSGQMSLIIDGVYAYAYPKDWFKSPESIDGIKDTLSSENAIYTLDGRKAINAQMQKGIYIINGKKVVK